MSITRTNRIGRLLGVVLSVMALGVGMTACAPNLVDSEFCLGSSMNKFQQSDGPSAPISVRITDGTLTIRVAGRWSSGSVDLELWNEDGVPVWTHPVEKSDQPKNIKVNVPSLKPGSYSLVNVANDATDGVICMAVAIN